MVTNSKRVLVAMSGGVDSSVAALLLKERGYDVIGASMNLMTCYRGGDRSCCSASDRQDARRVCSGIGAQYHVFDYRDAFRRKVIEPFIQEYLNGRTPSPCIFCNEHLKFASLFEEADRFGAAYVATGHYSRIVRKNGSFGLLKGVDSGKDQSYFLFTLTQRQLSRLLFPLGEMLKEDVRGIASRSGIHTHEKPDSQEICFVPDDDYVSFVEANAGSGVKGPGNFVDGEGNVVGRHAGIHAYTIGQRRGLGFGVGRRQYVIRIDRTRNEVVLGPKEDLSRRDMSVGNVSWVEGNFAGAKGVIVKIRSTHGGAGADLEPLDETSIKVNFHDPVSGVAPGQAAVFYDGDEVLGGGWID